MKIYLTRHGQTELNRRELMQGRTDEPLNENGITQAKKARSFLEGIEFDAVYSSPLIRAKQTASILSGKPEEEIITDDRIREVEFGDYELRKYNNLGPRFNAYWLFPEVFPNPGTVESVESMVSRSHGFLKELETKNYKNVLIVCHGGIMRPMSGYLMDKESGLYWRPRPKNCEIRVFQSVKGKHRYINNSLRPKS